MIITEPGLFDLPEATYHGDPVPGGSLSSTTAKRLLAPSCPAIARWEKDHPVIKTEYDEGAAAHKLVLGKGAQIVVINHEKWNTDAIKAEVAAARAAGHIPLKPKAFAAAIRMAEKVKQHPTAGPMFRKGTGMPERSIFWQDERTGVWCRAMLDWLSLTDGYRPMIVDLKTIADPSLPSVMKAIGNLRYYQQAAFYRSAVQSLGFEDPMFFFVFVGKEQPHLITVFELHYEDMLEGQNRNRQALDVWAECQRTGVWPGYSPEIQSLRLPPWTHRQIEETE